MSNIYHLFKLIWNRKKMNILMIIEIFLSFIILFILIQTFTVKINKYLQPLGFDYSDVWSLSIRFENSDENIREKLEQIKNLLREFSEILRISESSHIPYTEGYSSMSYDGGDIKFNSNLYFADDNFGDLMGITMLEGRWFNEDDESCSRLPIVIDKALKEFIYGDELAVGKIFGGQDNESVIVGVLEYFRKYGEFEDCEKTIFHRISCNKPVRKSQSFLLLKVKPGTDIRFEEKMLRMIVSSNLNMKTTLKRLEDLRIKNIKEEHLYPMFIFGFIGIFLIINVVLGLFGVLWYNINSRYSEIGLRRAVGASAKNIKYQILGETFIMTTFAILIGIFVIFQFKILDFIPSIHTDIFLFSLLISIFCITGITTICALYPSKLAAEIEPVEALHDE